LLLVTSAVARLPVAMTGLAIVLRVTRQMGSYSDAGAITAVYVMSGAVLGPRLGRLADRLGRSVVLVTTAAVNGVGVLLVTAGTRRGDRRRRFRYPTLPLTTQLYSEW